MTGPILESRIPYLGLEAFTEDKRHLFFGRDNFIEAIWQKLQVRQFVAVVGPSGSGKSSVVQAGVFPRLGSEWHKLVFQPGDDPFLNLADKFVEVRGTRYRHFSERSKAVETLARQIRGNHSIAATVTETLGALPQPSHLLLVADQFEELFTLTPTADRQPFAEAFLATSRLAELKVLVTLRADFFGQAISLTPELSQLIQDGVVTHRPLQRADWEAVILKPAKTVGLHVDPSLVALILEEVEAQPDSLPLLEYALKELWQHRAQGCIGLAEYEVIGKLTGAINQCADAVLARLPAEQQLLALRAITRLVRVAGEEGEADTRLRLPLNELPEADREVLQQFVTARLLVTKRQEGSGVETIEVAHEALIRRWGNLRKTLDSDREFLMWRQRLDYRSKAWKQKGSDDKWLLHGGERDEAHNWLKEREAELTAAEIDFITWDDHPDFQIERILSESPSLLLPSNNETRNNWFTTLVLCREKEKALLTAREIEDVVSREMALRSIGEALAIVGMATEALAVAREIENTGSRAETLRSIAETMAKAGMVTEALVLAREIEDANERAKALSSIAEVLMKAGLVMEAPAVAREIVNVGSRAETLRSIAETMAKAGMVTEALAVAHEIDDTGFRSKTLRSIAEALAKAKLATEALAIAREIKDADSRAWTMHSVAEALAEAGMMEAREAGLEALERIGNSIYLYDTTEELKQIVEILVKAGASMEALAIAREINSADGQAATLSFIVDTMALKGTKSEMREVVMEALNAAREIKYWSNRASVLSSIALAMAKVGMSPEACEVAMEALDAAKMTFSDEGAGVLISVAEVLATAGMATEALVLARKINNDEGDRADALCLVAGALAAAGMMTEAREAATEALDAATDVEYDNNGAYEYDFSLVAETLGEVGMAKEALDAAREIENAGSRTKTLNSIAKALIDAGMMTETLVLPSS